MEASTNIEYFEVPDFSFGDSDSTKLQSTKLAYKQIRPEASKVTLIPTCFRGRINETLTFADGALRDHRIIVVALFGNGESSSPSNAPDFPKSISYWDCVRAQHALLTRHLNIQSLDVIIGFSMGGQTAYHWTIAYPDFVKNAVIICSAARTSRHNYQFLEGPKAALEHSTDYVAGVRSSENGQIMRGLKAFGKAYSAWLTSAEWFEQGLYKELGFSSLQDWDAAITGKGYLGWNPDDLLAKLRMWQNGDISRGKEPLEKTLAGIKTRILLMPCQTDQYFSWKASAWELDYLVNGQLAIIPSVWGHIAGGGANPYDRDWMDGRIQDFLATF